MLIAQNMILESTVNFLLRSTFWLFFRITCFYFKVTCFVIELHTHTEMHTHTVRSHIAQSASHRYEENKCLLAFFTYAPFVICINTLHETHLLTCWSPSLFWFLCGLMFLETGKPSIKSAALNRWLPMKGVVGNESPSTPTLVHFIKSHGPI